jgi:hypothetical protein
MTWYATHKNGIVVGPDGNDSIGVGSFAQPLATVNAALDLVTTARKTIYILEGEYAETAITWPNITGVSLVGLGDVTISNSDAAAAVITIDPTYTASTFEATLRDVGIAADTQIGLKIDNSAMTKKLNVYLYGVSAEMDTSGDSIDMANSTATQAIRMYVDNCNFEGLVHLTSANAGGRFRSHNSIFTGGITTAGAVAHELSLMGCTVLTGALTIGSASWDLTYRGCVYATDADPAVYSELADGYSA